MFKPLDRSFADNRTYNRGPKGRPLSSYNRFGQATGNLSNIREESVELEGGSRLRDEVYRDFHTNTFQDNEYNDTEDEDDMADWDEESTLVAMLHDEWVYAPISSPHKPPTHWQPFSSRLSETKEDRLSALVNNLKTPINAYGLTLKQHLVQTFIPTAKQLKATHTAMESKVDIPFESGLLLFNDATRKLEDLVIREEDELRVAYGETQASFPVMRLVLLTVGWVAYERLMLYALFFFDRITSRNYSHSLNRHTRGGIKFIPNSRYLWTKVVAIFFCHSLCFQSPWTYSVDK